MDVRAGKASECPSGWAAKGRLLVGSETKTLSSEEVGLPSAITGWHYCSPQA